MTRAGRRQVRSARSAAPRRGDRQRNEPSSFPQQRLVVLTVMKGPSERLKYDLRRVWECPVCGRKDRTSGAVTFHYCRCQRDRPVRERVCMKLVKEGGKRKDEG